MNVQIKMLAKISKKKKKKHLYKSVQCICQSDAHVYRQYTGRVFFQNHPGSNSINIKIKWCVIKGIVHPKWK